MKRLAGLLLLGCLAFAGLFSGAIKADSHAAPLIYVINASSNVSDETLLDALPAFQQGIEDLQEHWVVTGTLILTDQAPSATSWRIILRDSTPYDVAGYHSYKKAPYAIVGTKTPINWQVVFSHELFEMLVDPHIDRATYTLVCDPWQGCLTKRFYLLEICDPVERQYYFNVTPSGKLIAVSDFVTENWYTGRRGQMDYLNNLYRHHQVLPGGYVVYYADGYWVRVYYNTSKRIRVQKIDGARVSVFGIRGY